MQKYLDDLLRAFKWFQANKDENGIKKLCEMRGYFDEKMPRFLEEYGVVLLKEGTDTSPLKNLESEIPFFSDKGNFLLEGRFIIPVKDLLGNIISFIGWFPDDRKYITISTKFLSKKFLLFGLEQFPQEELLVVEGIFDSLHARAEGIPCCAVMGIDLALGQKAWLNLCKRVYCLPDNDKQGRSVIEKDKWGIDKLECDAYYLNWWGLNSGLEEKTVKDMDLFCSLFDAEGFLEGLPKNPLTKVININDYL